MGNIGLFSIWRGLNGYGWCGLRIVWMMRNTDFLKYAWVCLVCTYLLVNDRGRKGESEMKIFCFLEKVVVNVGRNMIFEMARDLKSVNH